MQTKILGSPNEQFIKIPEPTNTVRKTSLFGPTEAGERMSVSNTGSIFVIDNSGSMVNRIGDGSNRSKNNGVQESLTVYTANILASTYMSIISFNDNPELLVPLQQVNQQNKLNIMNVIQHKLIPAGCTDILAALIMAEEQLSNLPAGLKGRVYLLTDGLPTGGDPLPQAQRIQSMATLYTIGFGDRQKDGEKEIDESLLQNMASPSVKGGKLYFYFDSINNLTGFLKEATKTLTL